MLCKNTKKTTSLQMFIQKCSHKTNSGDKGCTPTCEKMIEPLSVHAKEGMSKS